MDKSLLIINLKLFFFQELYIAESSPRQPYECYAMDSESLGELEAFLENISSSDCGGTDVNGSNRNVGVGFGYDGINEQPNKPGSAMTASAATKAALGEHLR